jgi:proline iminopeptidase
LKSIFFKNLGSTLPIGTVLIFKKAIFAGNSKNMTLLKQSMIVIIISILCFSCTKELYINDPGNLVPKTVDEDPSLPSITVNGIKLHSEAFGHPDSSLIIVLHGGPGADYRYLLKCKDFSNHGYRVIFYDQGGTGLSHRFPKSYYTSTQQVFDELKDVITHYKTHSQQKVFLLGHSWGGMIATAYINQRPAEITGVVVAEPGGFIWQDILEYVKKSKSVRLTSETLNDYTYIDQFLTSRKKDEHQVLDYKYAIQSASDGQKDSPSGDAGDVAILPYSFWRFGAINNIALLELGEKTKPNWTLNLNQYSTKVLFLYSQRNKAYGLNWARNVSSAFKSVELYEVLNAGHNMLSFQSGWNNSFPKMLDYFNSL